MQARMPHILVFAGVALLATLVIIWQLIVYAQAAPLASQFPIMVAVIALIGTLWTGAITFAGFLLKDSIDRRNIVLQTESDQRQAILQAESEKRLRMEAAIKAIELMSGADGSGVSAQESREGAIFVIASLNQHRLALTFAEQFWGSGKISTSGMVQIVDQCLNADDDHLKEDAAAALRRGSSKLAVAPDCLEFPDSTSNNWNPQLPSSAKSELLEALIGGLLSKEFSFWKPNVRNQVLYYLYKMFTADTEPRFKFACAMCAKALCDVMGRAPGASFMPPDRHEIQFEEISGSAALLMTEMGGPEGNITIDDYEMAARITNWKTQKKVEAP